MQIGTNYKIIFRHGHTRECVKFKSCGGRGHTRYGTQTVRRGLRVSHDARKQFRSALTENARTRHCSREDFFFLPFLLTRLSEIRRARETTPSVRRTRPARKRHRARDEKGTDVCTCRRRRSSDGSFFFPRSAREPVRREKHGVRVRSANA